MVKFLFRADCVTRWWLASRAAGSAACCCPPVQRSKSWYSSSPVLPRVTLPRSWRSAGIIRSQYAFLAWHYLHGRKALKAGEYAFDHPATTREVYDRIARGDIYFHTLVVPEGYNIFDIAAAIEEAGLGKRDDFLKVARTDTALVRDLDPQAPSLEGYLFPDTYHFTRTQSLHDMAAAMVRRFRQEAKEAGLNQNVHDVVTMASIVEKETGAPEERPAVASVFYNRMDKRMVLATDPSVIYAALLNNRYSGTIHQSDLHFDSPYNTYRRAGLPPGPISNPGRPLCRRLCIPPRPIISIS